uniref:Olfactory receptor family 13 subfamily D member 1 n=1 Tax=Capra hircus TaxID=9925 RepID=A0A452FX37_CAPHI
KSQTQYWKEDVLKIYIINPCPFTTMKVRMGNYSAVTEFFLVGLSQYPALQFCLFMLCLISLRITIRILDSYICYTSSSIPPTLIKSIGSERKSISFIGCALQMVVSLGLGSTECVLLTVMAYDRYLAICSPLRYPIIMNRVLYVHMATWSWIIGCLTSLLQTIITMILPFCDLLKLICSDITINVIITTVKNIVILVISVILIFISYGGGKKPFLYPSAHLTVVILFYGSALFMYMKPKSKDTNTSDEIMGLSYGVVTPMLNPIIYILRNKKVKEKVLSQHLHLWKM